MKISQEEIEAAWDGTFYPGEWQTRDGTKAELLRIDKTRGGIFCRLPDGFVSGWNINGEYVPGKSHDLDLIRPWPKPTEGELS